MAHPPRCEGAPPCTIHIRTDTLSQIYITDIKGEGYPKRLTTGKQGAASSPVIEIHETKVAWLEMDEDGYEADRFVRLLFFIDCQPPDAYFPGIATKLLYTISPRTFGIL